MRVFASALGAVLLIAGSLVPAVAQTQPKPPKPETKKEHAQERSAPRGNGYREQLADKLPFGSSAWWDQMRREGRLGGETP
jgi:hypothetical protein